MSIRHSALDVNGKLAGVNQANPIIVSLSIVPAEKGRGWKNVKTESSVKSSEFQNSAQLFLIILKLTSHCDNITGRASPE
jgi:hypothetical protein